MEVLISTLKEMVSFIKDWGALIIAGMLMGFFQGPRNLYQHNHIGSGVSNSISVIIEASFSLQLLDGHSITQNGRWIPETVDYREIYQKMPKRIDRWRLVRLLKKRARRLKKNP